MVSHDQYYWDRLATAEQAALLAVYRGDAGNIPLSVLNELSQLGYIEWLNDRTEARLFVTPHGVSAISHWRHAG